MPIIVPPKLRKTDAISIPEGLTKPEEPTKPVIPEINIPTELTAPTEISIPAELKPTKFHPYTFARKLATDIGLGIVSPNTLMQVLQQPEPVQDLTEEMLGEAAFGYGKGLTFGVSDFAMKKALEGTGFERPKPSAVGQVANNMGSLFGMWRAISGMTKLAPFRWLGGFKPTSKIGTLAKRVVTSGFRLGAYSVLSEWGGGDLAENLKNRGIAGAHGAGIGMVFGAIGSVAITPGLKWTMAQTRAAAFTSLALRLGGNQMLTGVPAYKQYKAGEESLPGLIYSIGLGTMFSLSNNPLLVEREFNNAVKRNNRLKNLSKEALDTEITKLGDYKKVPSDIKWAYIMKATGRRVKPEFKNVESTDQIFEQILHARSSELAGKLDFVRDIGVGVEEEMRAYRPPKAIPVLKSTQEAVLYGESIKGDKTRIKQLTDKRDMLLKRARREADIAAKTEMSEDFDKSMRTVTEAQLLREATEVATVKAPARPDIFHLSDVEHIRMTERGEKPITLPSEKVTTKLPHIKVLSSFPGEPKTYNKIYYGKGYKKIAEEVKKLLELPRESKIRMGRDYHRRLGKLFGYGDREIEEFVSTITMPSLGKPRFDIARKQFGFRGAETLSYSIQEMLPEHHLPPKEKAVQREVEADIGMRQAPPGAKIPGKGEIILPEFYKWSMEKGNWFDWLQTARIPVGPIYKIFKPAYEKYIYNRTLQYEKVRNIYKGKIKQGSRDDVDLALYADGRITLEQVNPKIRDIAQARTQFYNEYADRLVQARLLPREKVFNKDGTRKPYYHRIFHDVVENTIHKAGFALEDFYMPGEMPLAGPLKRRYGAKGYVYSAIESDARYITAIEKYMNLYQANDAATKMLRQIKSLTRKDMANVFVKHMRGQPTKADAQIKETIEGVVRHTGDLMKELKIPGAEKFQKWDAPSYPIARVASPLARLYYWRYVGLGMDTAFKNSLQWHHALAKHGPENTGWAARAQFTPEGKRLIEQSGIHKESIQRGGHFIEETLGSRTLGKVERGSYWLWSMFDINNRNISGLAAYKAAMGKGMSRDQALAEMRKTSHETQYGYTKADSLLMDMRSPFARFILFKKWPLAKVEMVRSWARDGHYDSIFNLALMEYAMYRGAQAIGIDMGSYFNSVWQLATRGLESPGRMLPVVGDIVNIHKMFGKGPEARKSKEKVLKEWRAFGNRWLGKAFNAYQAWQDDWNVRELTDGTWKIWDIDEYKKGKMKYKSSAQEQTMNLFFRPLEQTKRYMETKRMLDIAEGIKDSKRRIMTEVIYGDPDRAGKMLLDLINQYGEEYAQEFGKELKPEDIINMDTLKRFAIEHEIPVTERIRKRMPGRGLIKVPPGLTFKGKRKAPPTVVERIRGY